jgi:Protein of unknown function (DUF551)
MKWIKCSEQMPQDDQLCLVIISDTMFTAKWELYTAWANNPERRFWSLLCDACCCHDWPVIKDRDSIQYWMPLSALPEKPE